MGVGAQQEGADSGELRAWGFPLPQAARRSNAVSPLREEQQPDDANELEGGARSHANLQRVQRAAATRVEPTGVLARGAKMVGESLPMMVMGLFYKMTVPPEPMRLQAPSDPQVREKALVQGVAITSLFTEIQQRNSHYLRLLLALIFVSFYFLVVYWQVRAMPLAVWRHAPFTTVFWRTTGCRKAAPLTLTLSDDVIPLRRMWSPSSPWHRQCRSRFSSHCL